jgi:beta-lactamase regulating signal transducer with metallopeptidase domain
VLFRLVCPDSFESVVSVFGRLGGARPSAVSNSMVFIRPDTGPVSLTPLNPAVAGSSGAVGSGSPVLSAAAETTGAGVPDMSAAQLLLFIAVCAWLCGIAVMLLYGAVSYIRLRRRVSEATRIEGNIFETDAIASPFVLGFFRPKIYLPLELDETGRVYVLRHERAHIGRGDHLIRLLAYLTLSVHWFNPFAWLAFILSGRDMETSCDERVVRSLEPGARAVYGETLAGLAVKCPLLAGSPLAFGENGVKTRVRNVLSYKKPAFWIVCVAVIAAAAAALCLLANPKTEPGEAPSAPGNAALSVIGSGTDYPGVTLSMRAWELDTSPTVLTVDWQNSTKDDVIYGDYYHIYRLENGSWKSCAGENELFFHDIAYGLAPAAAAVKTYNNSYFDLSATGTYKLETYFFFDKDRPITDYDHYNVWIEFEISEKTGDVTSPEGITASADTSASVSESLEAAVTGFMEDGWWYAGEKHPGTFKASSFITLHEEETETGHAYYGVSLYRSYNFTENSFTVAESFQIPCVITLDKATLACTDFWVPGDGAYFDMDIVDKFPAALTDDVLLYTYYLDTQAAACDEKARLYGGFKQTSPLMAVTSDSTTVIPYENFLWASTYAEDNSGWLSGDGMSVFRDLGAVLDQLPTVTLREDFSMTCAADVAYSGVTVVAGESLEVLYRNADKMILTGLQEGTYYVAVSVAKQGDYIPAGGDYESEGYECVFRFVVDEHAYDNMLMSQPIAEKVCIDLRRTADLGLAGYLTPKDQDAWIAALNSALARAGQGTWKDSETSLGIWIVYQDDWWQLADSGALLGSKQRRVEAPDAAALSALAAPVIKQYYDSAYRPDMVDGIVSATLEVSGRTCAVTDAAALSKLENLLSTAKELRAGAGCPFGAFLGLETKNGSIALALATDDCATYFVNGVYYEYEGRDNKELYALFGVTLPELILQPTPARLSMEQNFDVFLTSLDYASDDIIIFHGDFGLFVYDLKSERIVRSLDLKPIDCWQVQGSNACDVTVSADGNTVQLHPMETEDMYVYTVSDHSLIKTAYQPMQDRFYTVPSDKVISFESGGYSMSAVEFGTNDYGYLHASEWTLGRLTYVRGDAAYVLFKTET